MPRQAISEGKAEALDYLAAWVAAEIVANEIRWRDFNPPEAFVACVAAEMVCQPKMGWPDDETARFTLSELWPDCEALC